METKSNRGSTDSDKEVNLSQEEQDKLQEEEEEHQADKRIHRIEEQYDNQADVKYGDEAIDKPTFTNEVVIIRP